MVKPDLQTEHASETPTTQNKLPLSMYSSQPFNSYIWYNKAKK